MKCEFKVNGILYPMEVLMKTAYRYIEDYYIFFDYNSEKELIISFEKKIEGNNLKMRDIIGEFKNDLLHENIRRNISEETRSIREIMFARALYGYTLESGKNSISEDQKYNFEEVEGYEDDIEKIGEDWFGK